MRSTCLWCLACSLASVPASGSGGNRSGSVADAPGLVAPAVEDAGGSCGNSRSSSGDGAGPQITPPDDAQSASSLGVSECLGGHCEGKFTGSYSSHLIAGIPLAVTGNVDLTLNQAGSNQSTCYFALFSESGGSGSGQRDAGARRGARSRDA